METNLHFLSLVLFCPLVFGLLILFTSQTSVKLHQGLACAGTALTLLLSLFLIGGDGMSSRQFSFDVNMAWMPGFGVGNHGPAYHIGIDGIGLLMVIMTTIVFPFIVGISIPVIKERTKIFYSLAMLLETAILGTFVSLDLILFYIFYEAMLIPLYFMVGMWGGPNRVFAALKFFLYTMIGSLLMLVSIISIGLMTGSFDLVTNQTLLPAYLKALGGHGYEIEMWLFLGFFAAFAVKAPLWPFHSWVPDAYSEAPVGAAIALVALKMGLYGFIRFCLPLFPDAVQAAAPVIVTLSVIGVIWAALTAAVQTDLRRLIAYSSISHIGVIMLAIFSLTAAGVSGAVVQMFSHTFTTGALFIIAYYLAARRGTYLIADYGGVWKKMPTFAAFFLIITLSAIALPGTSGFTGEFLMLIGAFQTHPWAAGIATSAAIWSAVYMLWMFQRVMHGPITQPEVEKFREIGLHEQVGLAVIVILIVWIGVAPAKLLSVINPAVTNIDTKLGILDITHPEPASPSPLSAGGNASALAPLTQYHYTKSKIELASADGLNTNDKAVAR
jgi:NADH-quinone oxidoreductase subunit M